MANYELVAFDMDGTLLKDKSCWDKLHRYFGTCQPSQRNREAYENGEITYDEFMRRDIALWKPKPHMMTIQKILLHYTFTPNAKHVVCELQKRKLHTAIITTGLGILTYSVACKLHISEVITNDLVFDKEGVLTDEVVFNVDPFEKHLALNRLVEEIGIPVSHCVAVGDSRYDANFLKNAGLGIAYSGRDKPDKELASAAVHVITDLKELLNFI